MRQPTALTAGGADSKGISSAESCATVSGHRGWSRTTPAGLPPRVPWVARGSSSRDWPTRRPLQA
jgi:hypothetical protein